MRTNVSGNNYEFRSANGLMRLRARSGANARTRVSGGTEFARRRRRAPGLFCGIRRAARPASTDVRQWRGELHRRHRLHRAIPTEITLLRDSAASYSAREIAFVSVGQELSDAQALAQYNAIQAYMINVGAALMLFLTADQVIQLRGKTAR